MERDVRRASACSTARGTYTAGQLVICPGAWAPQLLAEFGIPITVERQVLYWFDPVGGTAPFVDHPIFIDEDADRHADLRLPGDRRPAAAA